MEIVIRTDGGEQVAVPGAAGAQGAGHAGAEGAEGASVPPDLAAKAEALAAINAGPAHIPGGVTGEPIPDVVAAVYAEPGTTGGGNGTSAGSAPDLAEEATTMVEAEGE